ncbi:10502_t:CDS:2 [Cetraspora pellucida]|uniref:10502_t:CDS:1 n=1 Tax=Cetraspora pellucida TaxID=1433469 RepID=A0A9N9INE0_9GLOM|nr:10502_t:CDS:2 [Cetraspora pellucida]
MPIYSQLKNQETNIPEFTSNFSFYTLSSFLNNNNKMELDHREGDELELGFEETDELELELEAGGLELELEGSELEFEHEAFTEFESSNDQNSEQENNNNDGFIPEIDFSI